MRETRLYRVDPRGLDDIWLDVYPFIDKAADYSDGKYSTGDVLYLLKKGDMQLWVAYNDQTICSACVTQVYDYPKARRLFVQFCGGFDIESWLFHLKTLMQWGHDNNCKHVEIAGRKGWVKKLKRFGFKEIHNVVSCAI